MVLRKRIQIRRARRGVTLVELSIGILISSLLMVTVAALQYISGKAIKDLYNQTRTRSEQMRAIDQIHYRLANAKPVALSAFSDPATVSIDLPNDYADPATKKVPITTKVNVTAYRQINFQDPLIGSGKTSQLRFDAGAQKLFYTPDLSAPVPQIVASGPIDVRFALLGDNGAVTVNGVEGNLVLLLVRSRAYVSAYVSGQINGVKQYSIVDDEDGLTTVFLRNK